jgi:hypothetical protein
VSQTCNRCYRIVSRGCQSDTESADCPELYRARKMGLPISGPGRMLVKEAARQNVEANADWDEEASADTIYDAAFHLALDRLVDLGVPEMDRAGIAQEVAQAFAQP